MRAIIQERYGGPEQLTLAERPDPKVAPGEVLIRVKAAAVNPVDWKIGAGYLDQIMEVQFPIIPGWDVAGVVEAVGLDVYDYRVGDEVIGYARKDWVSQGTYAELVAANVRLIAPKPASLDWTQAAGLPLAGLTAYQSLDRVRVGEGDTVLVHAAAGGVGAFATQLAAVRGARVIGTASERNHDFLRRLGAEPVSYGEGLVERVRELAPDGVDAAVDCVGGESIDASRELLQDMSRLVSTIDPKAEELGGASMWVRPSTDDLAELSRLADEGKLEVNVDRVFPLEEAAEAWRVNQEGRTRGKIALSVS
ncbi:NADP-dependent oxidoreductase [Saccharomonospora sp.]|uniref:NADP-dependent oxidoreductase n=1 Tax=Saccharomonospora sp. TaxID=33913 RepID=UPI0026020BBC|nr:NADP-dependent oxidoreductase [Saccharomonospora sp.]